LHSNVSISKIKMDFNLTMQHIHEYILLWGHLNSSHLNEDIEDYLLEPHGQWGMYWEVWASPKVKFFAWLDLPNMLWTADRLEKRGWNNCEICPLCKQTQEMTVHIFSPLSLYQEALGVSRSGSGSLSFSTQEWTKDISLKAWWTSMHVA
jgi:hypothetical protein